MILQDIDITLLNKNNILRTIVGKRITDKIFDSNISLTELKRYTKNLEEIPNIKLIKNNYISKVFKKGNESFIEQNNELSYYITDIQFSIVKDNYLIINETIQKDIYIIPSINEYDSCLTFENLDINVGSYFIFKIKKNYENNKYSLEFIINKPNDIIKINDIIKKILL